MPSVPRSTRPTCTRISTWCWWRWRAAATNWCGCTGQARSPTRACSNSSTTWTWKSRARSRPSRTGFDTDLARTTPHVAPCPVSALAAAGLEHVAVNAEHPRLIDLSHAIEAGMTTYKGLPGPVLCDYWTREASRANYDDGSTFQIGRIDLVANTGTYVDSPFHRFEHGCDLAGLPLASLADLPAVVVRQAWQDGLA